MAGLTKILRALLAVLILALPAFALAAPATARETQTPSIASTIWQGEEHFDDGRVWQARYEFRADGTILETYQGPDSGTCEGRWEQNGDHISFWTFGNVLNRLEVDVREGVMRGTLHGPVSTAEIEARITLPLTS